MTNDKNLQNAGPDDPLFAATEAWLSVVRTYHTCSATITAAVAPLGINLLQHEVLVILLRTPDLTQQELAERCFSAKSGISMLIAQFEKDGIIDRRSDPADKRVRRLSLTETGTTLARNARQAQRDVVKGMASVYPEEEFPLLKERMDAASKVLIEMQKNAGQARRE